MTALTGGEVVAVLDHQTSVMERLAAGDPLPAVLDSIVLALEDLMPGSRCSILLLDDSGLLRHGSAPTLPGAYSGAIDGLTLLTTIASTIRRPYDSPALEFHVGGHHDLPSGGQEGVPANGHLVTDRGGDQNAFVEE